MYRAPNHDEELRRRSAELGADLTIDVGPGRMHVHRGAYRTGDLVAAFVSPALVAGLTLLVVGIFDVGWGAGGVALRLTGSALSLGLFWLFFSFARPESTTLDLHPKKRRVVRRGHGAFRVSIDDVAEVLIDRSDPGDRTANAFIFLRARDGISHWLLDVNGDAAMLARAKALAVAIARCIDRPLTDKAEPHARRALADADHAAGLDVSDVPPLVRDTPTRSSARALITG